MHLTARDLHRIDAQDEAVDLAQSPGEIVCLSFSDSDLGALAAAHAARRSSDPRTPSLRLANLARLKHPFSVDLYLEKTVARARFVLVRCLGGADYWRYGIDELASLCRAKDIALGVVPGDGRADERLDRASTLTPDELALVWRFFDEGGPDNLGNLLAFVASRLGRDTAWHEAVPVPAAGRVEPGCRENNAGPRALIVVYRSLWLAGDIAPAIALCDELAERGFAVETTFVSSLKDERVRPCLNETINAFRSDVIVNTTAFSARDGAGGVLDIADCPVIQAAFATVSREAWWDAPRGFGAVDCAMNVVLPEVDGRLIAPPISFKALGQRDEVCDFERSLHAPHQDGISATADLAMRWANLRKTPSSQRRLALVLSDYPLKGGREGYAVGLDTPASVAAIADALRHAGYRLDPLPEGRDLIDALARETIAMPITRYREWLAALPRDFATSVNDAWGAPETDPCFHDGTLHLRALSAGNMLAAFQPDRGAREDRRDTYHDAALPPRHAYVAFYLWLAKHWRADAMIHLGTHGTLEWLPGKSVALSPNCAPAVLTDAMPVIYPFIVNDPGEAAQARRRLAAVTVGHMTPPLAAAAFGEAERDIEALLDEYAQASGLDPRRAALIADAIFEKARASGLAAESGITDDTTRAEALTKLDAWLCDVKDLRLGDGLHVFGSDAPGEIAGLLAALDGRFVEPGPAGAPSRARQDVLPTGRNLFGIDPRAVPTRTAHAIGEKTAQAVVTRYLQDNGDYPRALMIDLWGSSTMRTGGEDFAQALALLGVRPVWDGTSSRVSGFEVISTADLGRARIDVTLRISGLFRDVFPGLIDLFDQAVHAVATLDEDADFNPLGAVCRREGSVPARVYGAAPGSYGTGIADRIARDRDVSRETLGQMYLDAQAHAFTLRGTKPDRAGFAARVQLSDALVHTQDMAETDILAGAAFAEEEGGFAAAVAALGGTARVFHVDATREGDAKVRTIAEEVARVARGKFSGKAWIAGLMRHGHRGAAEIAETVSNLTTFSVASGCVADATIDLAFDATLGDDEVRAFLERENPAAAKSIGQDFAQLRDRGLWASRRNSIAAILEAIRDVSRDAA